MKYLAHIRITKIVKKRPKTSDVTFNLIALDETHAKEIIKAKIKQKHQIINLIEKKDGK